ncbi:MAG: hypothetical protein CMJ83_20685 [Planctomycetes bacterium]|nr:hypothetical protein [Planctomycetota bacterium]
MTTLTFKLVDGVTLAETSRLLDTLKTEFNVRATQLVGPLYLTDPFEGAADAVLAFLNADREIVEVAEEAPTPIPQDG